MITQQRNIKKNNKKITFKRVIHGIVIEICYTCSNIAKTNTNSDVKTLKMPKKIYI